MKSEDKEPVALVCYGDEKNPLILSTNNFKGMRLLDLRRYYFDKTSKTIKPTAKGVSLKEDEFKIIAEFIMKNISTLQDYFTSDLTASETSFRGGRLEKKANEKLKQPGASDARCDLKSWPALQFFDIDESLSTTRVSFNKRIKFISRVDRDSPESIDFLKEIVIAYCAAKNSLNFKGKQNPKDIIENIEIEWSKNLNV